MTYLHASTNTMLSYDMLVTFFQLGLRMTYFHASVNTACVCATVN